MQGLENAPTLDREYSFVKRHYLRGIYKCRKTIIEKLESIGLTVNPQDIYNHFLACFDFESLVPRCIEDEGGLEGDLSPSQLLFLETHHPVSISLCSNVPGFFEKDLVGFDGTSKFIGEAVSWLLSASDAAGKLGREQAQDIFTKIDSLESEANMSQKEWQEKRIQKVRDALLKYYGQLRCFSFAGSFYDITIGLRHGLGYYLSKQDSILSALKCQNRYIKLSTHRLAFLDVVNYLGMRTNLRNFLCMWGDVAETLFSLWSSARTQ